VAHRSDADRQPDVEHSRRCRGSERYRKHGHEKIPS
jgi:hypothetical protein